MLFWALLTINKALTTAGRYFFHNHSYPLHCIYSTLNLYVYVYSLVSVKWPIVQCRNYCSAVLVQCTVLVQCVVYGASQITHIHISHIEICFLGQIRHWHRKHTNNKFEKVSWFISPWQVLFWALLTKNKAVTPAGRYFFHNYPHPLHCIYSTLNGPYHQKEYNSLAKRMKSEISSKDPF